MKPNNKLFEPALVQTALKQSFIKLDPRVMIKNPVMFTVEIGTLVMAYVTFYSFSHEGQGSSLYNFFIFLVLLLTVLFANFAEAIAEARGKAQADSLRKTREETPAKLILAIRESGGDKSSVTGGTKVLSDQIKVQVSTEPGESFLDKMIALVEGASRQKTPNEIALTILLASFTLVFIIVCVTLKPFADYANTPITIAALISLFVCLIPTTIGGLLSAIGIAGMDRALRANVITKSGKAVETAGDIDVLLLDKTGTITIGNRKATNFYPTAGVIIKKFTDACVLSSLSDETPEGKSIIELAKGDGHIVLETAPAGAEFIKFTAETRSSGINTPDGRRIRKGAFDSIRNIVLEAGNSFPLDIEDEVKKIASNGGTPLVVSENEQALGV
ncbi:MAG: potassium-transporting ATPase subunit B, partial [Acinetobacter sp.]